jgi:hypothetical protein
MVSRKRMKIINVNLAFIKVILRYDYKKVLWLLLKSPVSVMNHVKIHKPFYTTIRIKKNVSVFFEVLE